MNYLKTGILLASLIALFGCFGFFLGGQPGLIIALVLAAMINFFSYWFSDKIILSMYGAKQLFSGSVYSAVVELARSANVAMPNVFIIETAQPNAFATGRTPDEAAIAVTRGLVELLNPREMKGVIAHEIAHIKNHDTLIMTVAATIAGALGMLANFVLFFGGHREDKDSGNLLSTIAMAIFAPLTATIVQMAISRTREYAADRIGAMICRDPKGLASALQKIDNASRGITNHAAEENPATAHLFIINPVHMRVITRLFSTHPDTESRVAALLDLTNKF